MEVGTNVITYVPQVRQYRFHGYPRINLRCILEDRTPILEYLSCIAESAAKVYMLTDTTSYSDSTNGTIMSACHNYSFSHPEFRYS